MSCWPCSQPIRSIDRAEQADQAFDDITYLKGEAIIRMLERYVGEDIFRQGVRSYMKRYAYGNTVSDDLWAEMVAAGVKDIKAIADDFTLQPGVPLISVESAEGSGNGIKVALRQSRFGVDEDSRNPLPWHVPVLVSSVSGDQQPAKLLTSGFNSLKADVAGAAPIKVNWGQAAYYRSKYSDDSMRTLAAAFDRLPPVEQLGLLYDLWALGEAGDMPVASYLDLTRKMKADASTVVWRQVIETLLLIDGLYWGLDGRSRFDQYAVRLLGPVFAAMGWDKQPGEADNVAILRERMIAALGWLGEQAVISEARRRFAVFLANPDDPRNLPAAIRQPVIKVVGWTADGDVYEKLHELAKSTVDPVAKDQYFVTLAGARDKSLAQRSLDIVLAGEPANATGLSMISRVALENGPLAWNFVLDHFPEVSAKFDAIQRMTFVPSIGAQSLDKTVLKQLREFIDSNVPDANKAQVERFYADAAFRLSVRERRIPEIDAWIATNG